MDRPGESQARQGEGEDGSPELPLGIPPSGQPHQSYCSTVSSETDDMAEEATQQATQQVLDPRRLGLNNSGLSDADMQDVICILYPASSGAIRAASHIARTARQHILPNHDLDLGDSYYDDDFLSFDNEIGRPRDIALRMSSDLKDITMGFVFGRNAETCDFGPGDGDVNKRVSNRHFRIWVTRDEVLMLQDMSTNGTYVDSVKLMRSGARKPQPHPDQKKGPKDYFADARRPGAGVDSTKDSAEDLEEVGDKRMLVNGATIQIFLDTDGQEELKFVVRIPSRTGYEDAYTANLQAYIDRVEHQQQLRAIARGGRLGRAKSPGIARGAAATLAGPKTPPVHNMPAPSARPAASTRGNLAKGWDGGKKYNIIGTAGKGAFATVYKVATKRDGEVFAAKELSKRIFIKNGIFDQKVHNEMHIMKRLNHRHIVQYVEDIQANDNLYIIMEYVPGGDLGTIINESGPLREGTVKELARQTFSALEYLHERQITHRDIKPDNILIVREHPIEVKLSDFGLSKVIEDNETFLKTFCGTLLYCAPEVFSRYSEYTSVRPKRRRRDKALPHRYGPACDMWSFAAVLFMALSAHPPFSAKSGDKDVMLDKIMTTELDIRPLVHCHVSQDGISLLQRLLNRMPDERPMERECLSDPWLCDSTSDTAMDVDEIGGKTHPNPALDMRDDLTLAGESEDGDETDEDINGNPIMFQGRAKRLRTGDLARGQHPDFGAISKASPDDGSAYGSPPAGLTEYFEHAEEPHRPNRLFGEISEAALGSSILGSSGLMPHVGHLTLGVSPTEEQETSESPEFHSDWAQTPVVYGPLSQLDRNPGNHQDPSSTAPQVTQVPSASPVDQAAVFQQAGPCSPGHADLENTLEPKRADIKNIIPDQEYLASQGKPVSQRCTHYKVTLETENGNTDDATMSKSGRKKIKPIDLPIPDGYYYDPYDKSTHNAEYAAKMRALEASGGVVLHGPHTEVVGDVSNLASRPTNQKTPGSSSMPRLAGQSANQPRESAAHNEHTTAQNGAPPRVARSMSHVPAIAAVGQDQDSQFARPLPIYGKLITTPGSLFSLTINLNQRETSWGRGDANTLQYPNAQEVRVPKYAFEILFWRPGFDDALKTAGTGPTDWASIPNLYANIKTQTTRHISINGVKLVHKDRHGYPFGRLYTGDVVTVFEDHKTGQELKFTCEFFYGASMANRPTGAKPFEIHHIPLSAAASWPDSLGVSATTSAPAEA